jgi:hypothetical protein
MNLLYYHCRSRVQKFIWQKHNTRLLHVFAQAQSNSILIAMADQQEVLTGDLSEKSSQSSKKSKSGRVLFRNTESETQYAVSPHSDCVPLCGSDDGSDSESDGESAVPKKKSKSGPLHSDSDIDIQYSDNETDSIPSDLSDANSIFDDECDDNDNEEHVMLDSENRLADLEHIETVRNQKETHNNFSP